MSDHKKVVSASETGVRIAAALALLTVGVICVSAIVNVRVTKHPAKSYADGLAEGRAECEPSRIESAARWLSETPR